MEITVLRNVFQRKENKFKFDVDLIAVGSRLCDCGGLQLALGTEWSVLVRAAMAVGTAHKSQGGCPKKHPLYSR